MGRTSIVVVTYNHRQYIGACVRAVERAGIPPGTARLVLVDNASTDGTAAYVRGELLASDGATTRGGFPAELIVNNENLGFAGGNNVALRRAMAEGDEFAYLLNPDTEVEPGFLERAVDVARKDPTIAEVQSLLVRLPERDVVNTWATHSTFSGSATPRGMARASTTRGRPGN